MLEKIINITAEQLNIPAESITAETNFKEDLEADSLDLFELLSAVEDAFDVELETEELENVSTPAEVLECLKKKGVK